MSRLTRLYASNFMKQESITAVGDDLASLPLASPDSLLQHIDGVV